MICSWMHQQWVSSESTPHYTWSQTPYCRKKILFLMMDNVVVWALFNFAFREKEIAQLSFDEEDAVQNVTWWLQEWCDRGRHCSQLRQMQMSTADVRRVSEDWHVLNRLLSKNLPHSRSHSTGLFLWHKHCHRRQFEATNVISVWLAKILRIWQWLSGRQDKPVPAHDCL